MLSSSGNSKRHNGVILWRGIIDNICTIILHFHKGFKIYPENSVENQKEKFSITASKDFQQNFIGIIQA